MAKAATGTFEYKNDFWEYYDQYIKVVLGPKLQTCGEKLAPYLEVSENMVKKPVFFESDPSKIDIFEWQHPKRNLHLKSSSQNRVIVVNGQNPNFFILRWKICLCVWFCRANRTYSNSICLGVIRFLTSSTFLFYKNYFDICCIPGGAKRQIWRKTHFFQKIPFFHLKIGIVTTLL